jgi:O-antigen/teichoic acid export membrane protein
MTLKKEMTKGVAWSFVERGGQQIISFFLFVLIARLVGPEEYGLAMLCFIFFSFASLLILGLVDGVVSQQIKDPVKLSTLFWLLIGFGIILSSFCFSISGVLANTFDEPRLELLLKWISIVPLLLAGQAVPHMLVMQSMNFRVYAIRTLVATVVSGVVGVYMAFCEFGALAIIVQQVVLYSITNIILWFFIDWRPRFCFSRNSVKEVLSPGLKMMVSNILMFSEQQLPRLFIGNFLGIKSVAYFSFAFRMRFALQDVLITPALIVVFPALSRLKNNRAEQDVVLENVFFLIGLVVFPSFVLAALTAPLYVPILFGEKWVEAIPLLQLFLIAGIAAPFISLAGIIFRVHDDVARYLRAQSVIVGLSLITVYFLSQVSLLAASFGVVVFAFISVPVYFSYLNNLLRIRVLHCFNQLSLSILSTILMALLVSFYTSYYTGIDHVWFELVSTLFIGIVSYVVLNIILQKNRVNALVCSIKNK